MKLKKRKGNIMIVVAILLLILPAILILSNMGGNSLKVLVQNKEYHQELLIEDSLKLAIIEAFNNNLKNLRFNTSRDSIIIDGTTVYGNYYIMPNTLINLGEIETGLQSKTSLNTVFNIENLIIENLSYDNYLTTALKKDLPFQHTMNINFIINFRKNDINYKYSIELNTGFNIEIDTISQKAFISDISNDVLLIPIN